MSVTTLCGSNSYEISLSLNQRLEQFLNHSGNDDAGIERIDASTIDDAIGGEIINRLMSPSLFASHKLVVIRDLSKNTQLSEQFIEWLDGDMASDQSSDVIILDPTLDGRSKLYKSLKTKTDFKEFKPLQAALLATWVTKYVNDHKGVIGNSDANYLVNRAGLDQMRLASEIDKLLTHAPSITTDAINLLVEPNIDSTTFDLADAVFARDRAKALRLYQEQRQRRVEPILIIGSLSWQLHLLILVKLADSSLSSDQIAAAAGLNPWSVSKARQLAKEISAQDLKSAIEKLLIIDRKSKSMRGYNSDDALQHFLLSV